MYAEFFGLSKDPFSIAPDPRFLFMSEKHREALAHLLYGVGGGGGFVLLTGEIGAGKTTVCRAFLEQIPKHCDVAYIFNPKLTVTELLQSVCEEFHVAMPERLAAGVANDRAAGVPPPTVKDYVDAINRYLLAAHAAGRSAVLIIDEAQSLAPDVLEQLRLLTNLETHERKLLQIILIGQPELRDMLANPGLEQLAQRVIARCHLGALTAGETVRYVQHRLAVAGGNGGTTVPFEPEAMARLFQLTGGVPRRINLLAGRAMLGAYAHGRNQVDRVMVEQAAREVFDVRRGGGARAAAARAGASEASRSRSGSSGGGSGRASRPAPFGSSRPMGGDATASPRPGWPRGAMVLAALGLVGVALAVWWWRGAWQGGDASAAATGKATSAAAAGASGADTAAGAMAAASSAVGAASGRAAASAATLAADIRLDDPATVLASAWADESAAWRALAMAWKTPLPEGEVCGRAAAAVGLSCFRTRGGLATVRQLDRPGLVYLRLRDEPPVTALLVALDERGATLQTQTRHWQVSLAGLASVWRGDFATLWRTPPGWREAYGAASAPPLPVATRTWVAERLAEAGVAGDPGQPLRDRLWAYQVAQGLPTDGRLGPVTMMQLSRGAAGLAREPVLQGAALAPMPPASAVRSPAAAVQAASAVPSAAALAAARGAATAASPTAATTAAATAASSPSGR